MANKRIVIDRKRFFDVVKKSKSMVQAANELNMVYSTCVRYAKKFGIFKPNIAGKGINKPHPMKYDLNEILLGMHPDCKKSTLKKEIIKRGIKKEICEQCGLGTEWNNLPLTLTLHHMDGNNKNHILKNLQILCPNCHTQTKTWGSKNKKFMKVRYEVI